MLADYITWLAMCKNIGQVLEKHIQNPGIFAINAYISHLLNIFLSKKLFT